ncbi:TolC family protein [Nitrosomonas sp.]|uniref:TolC family protein n=1 Tax=Nitrosomonas sp. TaxID=42353 RepID=UPI002583245C|nr:TolC family protein [Nitrosomonas sp.]
MTSLSIIMMKYRAKKRSGSFHLEWVAFFLLSVLTGMIPVGDYGVTSANAAVPIADVQAGGISEKGDLTLRQVLQLVLQNNPELSAFNPEFSIEAEDINSSNSAIQKFATFRISQLIELGGKRPARVSVATLGQEVADQAYAAKRLEIIARTASAFIDVLENQAQVSVMDDTLHLVKVAMETVVKRVEAGKAPPMEAIRSKVALSTASIELEQARRSLSAARTKLALLWGEAEPRFDRVLGELESFVEIPEFDQLVKRLEENPVVRQSLKNVAQREAMVELEKARKIPDITVDAGIRRYLGTDDTTAVVGMSIPIPIFNRNQGNELEARQRLNKAMDERMSVELQLRTEFVRNYESLLAARNEIRVLHDAVLPGAQNAFEITNRGYQLGKFSFLEMLDAQRTFFQNRILYVRALANYQRLVNTIEQLIAAPLADSATDSTRLNNQGKEHNQ